MTDMIEPPDALLACLDLRKIEFGDLMQDEEFNCPEDFYAMALDNVESIDIRRLLLCMRRKLVNNEIVHTSGHELHKPEPVGTVWKDHDTVYVRR